MGIQLALFFLIAAALVRTNNDLILPLLLLIKANLKTDLFVISKSKEDSQYKVKFRYTYLPDKYFVNDLCIRIGSTYCWALKC